MEIEPALADHVAPVFAALCRTWVRRNRGGKASRVGSWWGTTTAQGRARGRGTEEIEPEIVLLCRTGFTDGLREAAETTPNLTLVTLGELVAGI